MKQPKKKIALLIVLLAVIALPVVAYAATRITTDQNDLLAAEATAENEKILATYGVNEAGKIYGSLLLEDLMDVKVELISVIGVNNVAGFVRAEDFDPPAGQPANPEEALAYMKTLPDVTEIPVYAVDGVTVVDSFVIDNRGDITELR